MPPIQCHWVNICLFWIWIMCHSLIHWVGSFAFTVPATAPIVTTTKTTPTWAWRWASHSEVTIWARRRMPNCVMTIGPRWGVANRVVTIGSRRRVSNWDVTPVATVCTIARAGHDNDDAKEESEDSLKMDRGKSVSDLKWKRFTAHTKDFIVWGLLGDLKSRMLIRNVWMFSDTSDKV